MSYEAMRSELMALEKEAGMGTIGAALGGLGGAAAGFKSAPKGASFGQKMKRGLIGGAGGAAVGAAGGKALAKKGLTRTGNEASGVADDFLSLL